jgi:DNA-binding MarR family transcriptional regulator
MSHLERWVSVSTLSRWSGYGLGVRSVAPPRQKVLEVLAHGKITSPDGRATSALHDAANYDGSMTALTQLLGSMERDQLVTRDVVGKRCYEIALTESGRELAAGLGAVVNPDLPEPQRNSLLALAIRVGELEARVAQLEARA